VTVKAIDWLVEQAQGCGATTPQYKANESPIVDMGEDVLCGRLGEICERRLSRFPRAYSWPSLVLSAGVVANQKSELRSNLQVALCGPVGTGKTTAIDHGNRTLGLVAPELVNTMAGSVEGLLDKLKDAHGTARLYFPDELSHLFAKAQIEHSAFCPVLNRAFYQTQFDLTVAGRKVIPFDCSLSVAGGLVLDDPNGGDNFEDCFNSITTGGTYDRYLFGRYPRPFTYSYRPFEGAAEKFSEPAAVGVEPAVWELRDEWIKSIPGMTGRVAEIALRVASICVGFDGVTLLRVDSSYINAALALAKYQIGFRNVMRPNPGKNDDAKCAFAILRKIEEIAPNGEWIEKRLIGKRIHAERYGPGVFYRAGHNLILNGEIDQKFEGTTRKAELWRRL
jgi:hypothetical protein